MKRILLFAFAAFTTLFSFAQTTVQSEDFTTYLGTSVTVPAGWTFSYNGNYNTTASSGTSGPNSYKFGVNNATITSPMFTSADTLSFWVKGNGTDAASKIVVLESADNITYDTIVKLFPLPTNTTGQTYKYPVMSTSHYIQFVYVKSVGNAAFDDYRLFKNPAVVSSVTADFTAANVCAGDSVHFMDQTTGTGGPVTSWLWNFDDGSTSTSQNPVHFYSTAGGYEVTLTVIDSSLNTDTFTDSVYVYSNPVAGFMLMSSCNGTLDFMDMSFISNGTITGYSWNFGDPASGTSNVSSLADPSHTFSSNGTYNVTEIVTSNHGCTDTVANMVMTNTLTAGMNATVTGDSVFFTGSVTGGSGPYNYGINFGDGSPNVMNDTASHLYADGTYTACFVATDIYGCMDTSCTTFTILTTNVATLAQNPIAVTIAPNPSDNGIFTVTSGNAVINIYNILGESVLCKKVTEGRNTFNLSDHANGSYFVTVKTDKQMITKKIIINK